MDRFNEINNVAKGVSISSKGEKVAWSDLVDKYPDKWIFFTDIEIVYDDRQFLCKVLEICTDKERTARRIYYLDNGINAVAMRTTSTFNGVIGG